MRKFAIALSFVGAALNGVGFVLGIVANNPVQGAFSAVCFAVCAYCFIVNIRLED